MNVGITFTLCSLFYAILLTSIFFYKKRLSTYENRIYSFLILTSLFGTIIGIPCYYIMKEYWSFPISNIIFSKSYIFYLLTWITLFTVYIYAISNDDEAKIRKVGKVIFITYIFLLTISLILPLYYVSENNIVYSYGPSANFMYIVSILYIVFILFCLLKNIKRIKSKKYIPIFAFIVLGTIVMIIQKLNPGLLLMTSMETFVTFLMYFTIENPDLKMIHELNMAKEQAERANHAKTDFLSSMSHEIRTPLNAIVGFSQALTEEDIPDSAKEEVKDILMASENLLELVNGILDISKIEANKLEIINTEYQIQKVLDDLVVLTKARLGEKPIEFHTSFDASLPPVLYGDYTRIKQIVLNLLTNSVKYTKEGSIDFSVSSIKKEGICRLIFSVEDTGIGIKSEKIDKLFTKFERFDIEKNITIEGTGLGLAITKKLVELMNGRIIVQSVYGKGSRFTVSIDQKIIDKPIEAVQEKEMGLDIVDASNLKILVVDDNKINLKVAERLLRNYNAKVISVFSGFECIQYLEENQVDLILMDDMMPKMSGVETLRKLRENPMFQVPVVALTANAISGMKEKYLEEGFQDYLSKPIDKKELNRVIQRYSKKD